MKDELVTILDQEARRTDFEGIWPERSIKTLAQHGLLGLTLPIRPRASSAWKAAPFGEGQGLLLSQNGFARRSV